MRRSVNIALAVTASFLAAALGAFSIMQVVKNSRLETKVRQLETSNRNLSSQVEALTAKNGELEKTVKSEREKAQKARKETETAKKQLESVQKRVSEKTPVEKTKTATKTQAKTKPETQANSGRVAYLTFDDGPSSVTPAILDTLKANNVKATFFVIASSKDTPQRRALMKREVDEGHTVGIHSWSHKYSYIYASEANFMDDFNKIREMIISATGVEPKFSRFPGGTNNTVSIKVNNGKLIMPALLKDVQSQGFTVVDWNAGGMDAVSPVPSKEAIVKGIVNQCKSLNRAIILLHDSETHKSSAEAVPEIIRQLKSMGFTFKAFTSSDEAYTFKPATKK